MKTKFPIIIICLLLVSCSEKSDQISSISEFHYLAEDNFGETKEGYLSEKIFYKYSKEGLLIEKTTSNTGGEGIYKKNKFEYSSGLLSIEKEYESDGKLRQTTSYKYNSNGYLIEKENYKAYDWEDYGFFIKKHKYKYNSKNQLIEETTFEPFENTPAYYLSNGKTQRPPDNLSPFKIYNLIYDESEKNIEKICSWMTGGFVFRSISKYDSNNNVIENIDYDENENVINQVTYQYNITNDDFNNWTRKIIFKNFSPTSIVERQIEYYPNKK